MWPASLSRLFLASAHVMLGELKEATAIVDSVLKELQSRGPLDLDQVLDLQVPLLRAQALIKVCICIPFPYARLIGIGR